MNPATQRHRAQQLLLRRSVLVTFDRLWPALEWERLDDTYPAFAKLAADLVARNRQTSTGLALAYLRALRRAHGVRGTMPTRLAAPLVLEQFHASMHATTVAAIKAAAGRGDAPDVAMANGLSVARGVAARLVLNAGRETITETSAADPAAKGWRRVLGSGGCDFCRERADQPITSDTVFEAHGQCGCTAEPVFA